MLIAGGIETFDPSSYPSFVALRSAETYDFVTGTWTITGDMMVGRVDPTSTLLADGEVLVAGGEDFDLDVLQSAEIFSPATGTWHPAASLNIPRTTASAALLQDGTVLVAGGFYINHAQVTCEIYTP
ncbi:MAG: kelch repeat-containing protein [Planctomycetota bacterium]